MRRLTLVAALLGCQDGPAPPPVGALQQPIVNGRRANAGDLASTVPLVDGEGYTFCTGTLVTPTVIVTAAHCFQDEQGNWLDMAQVRVASNVLSAYPAQPGQVRRISRYVAHPRFTLEPIDGPASGLGRDHDIGVIVLADGIFDQPPTPILPAPLLDDLVANQTQVTVSGYGINNLNQAQDRPGVLHIGETPYLDRSDWELLAGGRGLTDTCNGDSGGPAYVEIGGARYLVGATSRAAHDSQGECGDRGIYTLVPAYVDWLEAEIGASLGGAPEPEPDAPPPPLPPVEPEPEGEPDPAPEPLEPEPLEPEPMEPEPLAPEPDGAPAPEPDGDGCSLDPDAYCDVLCARVDPDCAPLELADDGASSLRGGCVTRPGSGGGPWWLLGLLAGVRRHREF